MVTVTAVTRMRHVVTGARVLTPVSAVGVITQGVGVHPAVSVVLGHRTVRGLPGVILPLSLYAWVRSVLVVGRAHRFLSGRLCGRDTLTDTLGGYQREPGVNRSYSRPGPNL
ncbi:hypothetical protein [Streptomyces sp. NWU49]|uniref:hypothetical protein n=1 Tax=Streptomyces sp. NWU49 TaxID=2201153 RepID=UPI001C62A809|nr:hypothetical protein [Streptomyces sp. NWU49]